jgi:type I restriction enzyme R subunit
MPDFISEDNIEKAAVRLLTERYGYRSMNCYTAEAEDPADGSERLSKQEVVFLELLRKRMIALNPDAQESVIDIAIEQLTARRYAMSPVLANKEVYGMIRDGIPLLVENDSGKTEPMILKVIDFDHPENNDFLVVTQLWIKGERCHRRPDILIYINGLPFVFIELKNSNVKVKNAYDDNLTNYRHDIPLLFQYNAFCVLTNALETKVGSFTACCPRESSLITWRTSSFFMANRPK